MVLAGDLMKGNQKCGFLRWEKTKAERGYGWYLQVYQRRRHSRREEERKKTSLRRNDSIDTTILSYGKTGRAFRCFPIAQMAWFLQLVFRIGIDEFYLRVYDTLLPGTAQGCRWMSISLLCLKLHCGDPHSLHSSAPPLFLFLPACSHLQSCPDISYLFYLHRLFCTWFDEFFLR